MEKRTYFDYNCKQKEMYEVIKNTVIMIMSLMGRLEGYGILKVSPGRHLVNFNKKF